jgi:general stress protein CsbA
MKNEVITLLKGVAVVIAGVLIANAIERKYMSTKTLMPLEEA